MEGKKKIDEKEGPDVGDGGGKFFGGWRCARVEAATTTAFVRPRRDLESSSKEQGELNEARI